jgi:hypothetical protein
MHTAISFIKKDVQNVSVDEVEAVDVVRVAAYIRVRRRLKGHVAEDLGNPFRLP